MSSVSLHRDTIVESPDSIHKEENPSLDHHKKDSPQKTKTVLILDCGSQYTDLIARQIKELGFLSQLENAQDASARIKQISENQYACLIISGSPQSTLANHKQDLVHEKLVRAFQKQGLPILGICYGMQRLVQIFGGEISSKEQSEFGKTKCFWNVSQSPLMSSLFQKHKKTESYTWMSHADVVKKLPENFIASAHSEHGHIVAAESIQDKITLLQFHPEVSHTEYGSDFFKSFLGIKLNQKKRDFPLLQASQRMKKIQKTVGNGSRALCALSGGVDSLVAASLVYKAMGDRLQCILVNHGFLREGEAETVQRLCSELQLPYMEVDAKQAFLKDLQGITEPEEKRKRIGKRFIDVFEQEAKKIQKTTDLPIEYLVQGTLYPDRVESSQGGSHKDKIKSHHNTGGLPERVPFKLLEPLDDLYKDQVRSLGEELNLPKEFLYRHPFPGPGLAIRCVGAISKERLDTLRKADQIYISSLKKHGLYHEIWQAGAFLLPVKSVGIQGDARAWGEVICLRAVESQNAMTARAYHFSGDFLEEVSSLILNELPQITRVLYDCSNKPPSTIEWE